MMAMQKEKECEALLEHVKDECMQERVIQKGRFSATMFRWISFPCIFLLGLAAGWFARSHLYSISYAYNTSMSLTSLFGFILTLRQ